MIVYVFIFNKSCSIVTEWRQYVEGSVASVAVELFLFFWGGVEP